MKRHLIIVGGTWETKPYGLLGDVVARTSTWQPHWVGYPASYGSPMAYDMSKAFGKKRLGETIASLPPHEPFAIIGYSQGAAIVEEQLREMAARPGLVAGQTLKALVYVGLIASPYRPRSVQIGVDPGGFGIGGPLPTFRSPHPNPIWQHFALAGDLVTACPPDSLIRIVEELTPAMSAQDPVRWGRDLQTKLNLTFVWKHFPELRTLAGFPRLLTRIREAAESAAVYQGTQIHTKYSTVPIAGKGMPATRWIANELNGIAQS